MEKFYNLGAWSCINSFHAGLFFILLLSSTQFFSSYLLFQKILSGTLSISNGL